jgi:hypothetical protein
MKRTLLVVLFTSLSSALSSAMLGQPAPGSPASAPPADKPVEQSKKNIKVLQGLPTSQLIPVMAFMSNSLGVTCAFCHTKEWESDEKEQKQTARKMIGMMRDINQRHFDGDVEVTCNTCHQGRTRPLPIPSLANVGWAKPPAAPEKAAPLPSVEEVIGRYVKAMGGAKAFAEVRSQLATGVVSRDNGRSEPVSKPFSIYHQLPSTSRVDTELSYPPEANREVNFNFFRPALVEGELASLRVVGMASVRGHEAFVVEARSGKGRPDQFYIDARDGLLLRRRHETETPLGVLPEEYDFEDYRTVDAIKVPFRMSWSRADYHVVHLFDQVTNNVPEPPPPAKK